MRILAPLPISAAFAVPSGHAAVLVTSEQTVGGTKTSGATGWGPGNAGSFRIDPFEAAGNAGQTFTITGVTFGTALIPEPSSAALLGLCGLAFMARHRRA